MPKLLIDEDSNVRLTQVTASVPVTMSEAITEFAKDRSWSFSLAVRKLIEDSPLLHPFLANKATGRNPKRKTRNRK